MHARDEPSSRSTDLSDHLSYPSSRPSYDASCFLWRLSLRVLFLLSYVSIDFFGRFRRLFANLSS
jgi:hypothetical protein